MNSKNTEILCILLIFFLVFFVGWHYGFININPIDNFTNYNSGYLLFKGNIPFKDYWVTTGPLLDFIQFLIFKINGVNWGSYVIHAAMLNSLFGCTLYFIFRKFNLETKYSLIYSLSTCLIFYTQVGVPFVDHHSSLFSILAIMFLILGVNFKKNFYWFLVPVFLILAFLSKQTPASYFLLIIIFFATYNLFFKKNFENIIYSSFSCILIIFTLSLIFYFFEIDYNDFFTQYISFASSVGQARLEVEGFIKPFSFSRYFIKFKLIHISYFLLLIYFFKRLWRDKFYYKSDEFITILILISSAYLLIFHQLLTLNVKFIYFYIPILCGFVHIFIKKQLFLNSKKIISLNFIILFISFSYYFGTYILNQKFQYYCYENNKNINSIKTKIIDERNFFNWKSCLEKDPIKEVEDLKQMLNYLDNNILNNYLLISDYQFINTRLKNNRNKQINKWYHPGVSYPDISNKNHQKYKEFLIRKIKQKNVRSVIFTYPSHFKKENQNYFEKIFKNCLSNQQFLLEGKIYSINIENCN